MYAQEACSKPHSVFSSCTHVLEKEPQASTTRKEEGERNKVTPTLVTLVANALENEKR